MSYWNADTTDEIGGVGVPRQKMDFSSLIGATIDNVGFLSNNRDGGFTIDYTKRGEKKRIVFGFNDLGFWKQWEGDLGKPSEADLVIEKIRSIIDSDDWCGIDIIDDPLMRRYLFKNIDGKVVLSLSMKEIRLLPEELRKPFMIVNKEKRDKAILMTLSMGVL